MAARIRVTDAQFAVHVGQFDYAAVLVTLAERCAAMKVPTSTALAATGNRPSELRARVLRLLDLPSTPTRPSPLGVAIVALLVVMLLATPLVLQTFTLADTPKPAENKEVEPSLEAQLRAINAELTYVDDSNVIVALRLNAATTDSLLARLVELPKLKQLYIESAGQVTDVGLQHIAALHQLEGLQLAVMNLTEAGVAHISHMPKLVELQMRECHLDDNRLAQLGKMTQLTSLRIGQNSISDVGITHLRHLTNLRELDISYDERHIYLKITDAGFKQLSELHDLRSLSIVGTSISYQGLRELLNFPKLQQLALGGPFAHGRMESIAQLTDLRELTLLRTKVKDEQFGQIRQLKKLTHLRIVNQGLSNAALSHLQYLPKLEMLDVRCRLIDNGGLAEIAKIKTLKQLHLYGSLESHEDPKQRFDEEGYRQLAGLEELQKLYLYNLALAPADLEALNQLKLLHVGCTSLTETEIRSLERLLPGTTVTSYAVLRLSHPSPNLIPFARHVQEAAHMELILDKPQFFLGENMLVHYRITNKGDSPFRVDMGSDGRNSAARPLRFKVVATDEHGVLVEDPHPRPADFGGTGGQLEIRPGRSVWDSLSLAKYCNFTKPGTYKLRVFHDLGWGTSQEYVNRSQNKMPTGKTVAPILETTLRLVAPTTEQARQVIEDMRALSTDRNQSFGKRVRPYANYSALHYAEYLPILKEVIANSAEDELWAVVAISSIHTPAATTALIELLTHENETIRSAARDCLIGRVPDPDVKKQPNQFYRNFLATQRMRKRSWSATAHKAAVLELAWRLMESEEPKQIIQGATVIGKLGSAADAPRLAKLLDRVIYDMATVDAEQMAYPRPGSASLSTIDAAWRLAERGAKIDTAPDTRGEMALYLLALGRRPGFRPAGWEATVQHLMKHPIPILRALTLENLPQPIPESLQQSLLPRINDRSVPVQIVALNLAGQSKLPLYLDAVRLAKSKASDMWTSHAADTALGLLQEN